MAEALEKYLDKTLRITISDGRLFSGQMKCTDRDLNIILGNAMEHKVVEKVNEESRTYTRYVGLVVVPGDHIRRICVEEFDPSSIT